MGSVVRDQYGWIVWQETSLCRYCGERPICLDIVVRDQSVRILR